MDSLYFKQNSGLVHFIGVRLHTTSFEYDGIDQLFKVTDTEGNVTTSVYEMGDRRTEVNHLSHRGQVAHLPSGFFSFCFFIAF